MSELGATLQTAVNPVFLAIVKGMFRSMVREMAVLIDRTAVSPVIREKKDYSIGVYTATGRMILAETLNQGPGLVDPVLAKFPVQVMRPGDIYWYNDPYLSDGIMGHSQDMAFCVPVFVDQRVVAFVGAYGHFWDIGGLVPGSISPSATEIYHEGILVPPIRICKQGEYNEDALDIILRNSRYAEAMRGDVQAFMSACKLGEQRLRSLFDRYGVAPTLAAFEELIESSARAITALMREKVAEGEYVYVANVDEEGPGGRPLAVQVKLVREGDRFVIDLTGSSDQVPAPINSLMHPRIVKLIFARYLQSFQPEAVILNDGIEAVADEVLLRRGSLVWPNFPAPVGMRAGTKAKVIEAMMGVMALATGGATAACSSSYAMVRLKVKHQETGLWSLLAEGFGVGQGARPFADGIDSVYFIGQQNNPVEWLETEYPFFRVQRYGIMPDSGGAGQFRGGVGIVREIQVHCPEAIVATSLFAQGRFPAFGVGGGQPGRIGRFVINHGTPQERVVPPIAEDIRLRAGDVLRIEAPGGGGWGSPLQRDAQAVLRDVRRGYVSAAEALNTYGVVIDQQTGAVDAERTARSRELRSPGERNLLIADGVREG